MSAATYTCTRMFTCSGGKYIDSNDVPALFRSAFLSCVEARHKVHLYVTPKNFSLKTRGGMCFHDLSSESIQNFDLEGSRSEYMLLGCNDYWLTADERCYCPPPPASCKK